MIQMLHVLCKGSINIGNKELDCAVLNDGTRILTSTAIFKAFDRPRKGRSSESYRLQNVPVFINANNLKPFIDDILGDTNYEVEYHYGGRNLIGYKADILPMLCDIYLSARDANVLTENQKPLAEVSDILIRSLAKVGITSLIDEATGYQKEREDNELQLLLSKYIAEEFLPWVKTFPDEFYIQMFRLKGWDYKGRLKTPYAGVLTNYLVYERLPQGVLDELRRLNPIIKNKGYRRYRFHQRLSKEQGYTHLEKHIMIVTTMMKGFDTWEEFDKAFRKAFDVPDKKELPPNLDVTEDNEK